MRALAIAVLLAIPLGSALAHQDRDAIQNSVAVGFPTSEKVVFGISAKGTVTSITIHIGKSAYVVPRELCCKVHDVRFESVALYWNGSYKTAASANYFYIRFDMGPDSERAFGSLPRASFVFRRGKFAEGVLIKKTDARTWQEYDLATGKEARDDDARNSDTSQD